MTTQATVKIAITVPRYAAIALEQRPSLIEAWLHEGGLWPQHVHEVRWRIDPLHQGTVIELEVMLPVGDK